MQDRLSNGSREREHDIVLGLAIAECLQETWIAFAACQSGLYRSLDSGCTWHAALPSDENYPMPPATAVALSPDFKDDRTVFAAVPGGMLTSADTGNTWHVSVFPTPPPVISSLVASPGLGHDGIVLAGTLEDGVFRSEDRGRTWSLANSGLLDQSVLSLQASPEFARDGTVYAGTGTGLFLSTNQGRSWREAGAFADGPAVTCLALSTHFRENGTLFAGTEENGLWRSRDRGRSWMSVSATLATRTVNDVVLDPLDATRHAIVVLTDRDLQVSQDDGTTWSSWNHEFVLEPGTVVVLAPCPLIEAKGLRLGSPGCRIQEIVRTA